ncbi:MAG: SDR family NAD(P)-dependent oxidoreductase [Thermoanaerobaculales bacterium]|jgi:NAD(P)-dependent dehydrogenase (short-subunit alcohol dehydrogenase family)|nr:SDR family NAD(P)-dependent oxidoreductase [Thermoanaerobaculales bacterium]
MATICITGTTRGLGRALVGPLAGLGHTVVGCGRSAAEIGALRAVLAPPHRFDVVDVADWPRVEAWAREVLGGLPPPDLLVNNAGVINRTAPLWEVGDDELRAVLAVNVGGVANLIRAFLPAMVARGSGVVVNLSSGWGRSTAPEVAPYCASKWAVEGMTRALAQELPAGLAAVTLNPGIIDTAMLRSCWADSAGAYPSPDEWAERAVPLLLSLGPEHNGRAMTV